MISQRPAQIVIGSEAPTRPSSTYEAFNGVCEFEEDSIHLVKTGKHSDDIGTWIGVTFRQDIP